MKKPILLTALIVGVAIAAICLAAWSVGHAEAAESAEASEPPGEIVAIAGVGVLYLARVAFGLSIPVPQLRRQVPDWWRTFYGPHVAASLYGAGLGIGFLTFLRYGTYIAVCTIAVASGVLAAQWAMPATKSSERLPRRPGAGSRSRTTNERAAACSRPA